MYSTTQRNVNLVSHNLIYATIDRTKTDERESDSGVSLVQPTRTEDFQGPHIGRYSAM